MNNKSNLYIFAFTLILFMSFISAETYLPHQQNTDLNFSVTSNFASNCTLTNINTPDGIITINQLVVSSGTFDFNVLGGNYTSLGTYTHNIVCTDGTSTTTGQEYREVTSSGKNGGSSVALFIFVIVIIYLIAGVGFFGKNIPITILGGMAMIGLGVYTINEGLLIYRDWITNYFSYLTISLGALISIWATYEQFID